MKRLFLIFSTILLLCHATAYSQQNKKEEAAPTKFGLVLSGGGAKGLAHIGILRMIDSLQIHVDYLAGTSMGSVLAGLYSIGYTGDSLKTIVGNADWQRITGNTHPYNKIHIREKDEYDAYALEFPIIKGIPTLPNYIIEGQYLSEVLQKYTFPVHDVHDFHALPTPLEIMTTDIVNGGLIVQRYGYLPLAIRASLGIPAVFSPTIIDGKILSDGGLERNYPVEEIRNMGAEYVIGSYTGFRTLDEEEIKNPLNLINQTYALNSKKEIEQQKSLANITLDFSIPLKNYTGADFSKYREIVAIGEHEARKLLPQLIEIKKMQQEQGISYKRYFPEKKTVRIDTLNILDESGAKFPAEEVTFIRNILGEDIQQLDNEQVLQDKIERIVGYNFADKVFYSYSTDSVTQKNSLNFFIKKKPEGTFHAAVHYDTHESAGIILNYTYRDLLFNQSRLSAKVNIAERAKARVNYYKFLDTKGKMWLKWQLDYSLQKSNDLYFKFLSQLFNYSETSFNQTNMNVSFSSGISFTPSSELQLRAEFNNNMLLNPRSTFSDYFFENASASAPIYRNNSLSVGLLYNQNSLNKKYFATRGNRFQAQVKLFLQNQYRLNKPDEGNRGAMGIYMLLHPDSSNNKLRGNILQFSVSEHYVLPITQKISLHGRLFYGINLDLKKNLKENFNDENYLFLNQKFYLGGYANMSDNNNNNIFNGLKTNEYPMNNVASLYLGLQYNILNKLYVTPAISVASRLASLNPFARQDKGDAMFGYGIDVDYMGFVGPIKLSFSRCNLINKNRIFFSFGYAF